MQCLNSKVSELILFSTMRNLHLHHQLTIILHLNPIKGENGDENESRYE